MSTNLSINTSEQESKELDALQALQQKHWERLNVCHICRRSAGKHRVLDKRTMKVSTYIVSRLMKCQHNLKICDDCYDKGACIIKVKLTKAQKKARKKAKARVLKAERGGVPQL